MRYVVASGIACLVVLALLAHHWWVTSMVSEIMARARAGLPPGSPVSDMGIPLTGRQMLQIKLDHLFARWWFVVIPIVVAICFVVAFSLPRARSTAGVPPDSSEKAGNDDGAPRGAPP